MSSDDNKYDDPEDTGMIPDGVPDDASDDVNGLGDFVDSDPGDYSVGEDTDFDADADFMEADEVFEDPVEEPGAEGDDESFPDDDLLDGGTNKSSKSKMMASVLVLVCAAGVGGYIIMSGGSGAPPMSPQAVSTTASMQPSLQPPAQQPAEPMPPMPAPIEQPQDQDDGSFAAAPEPAPALAPKSAFDDGFGDQSDFTMPDDMAAVLPVLEKAVVDDVAEDLGTPPVEQPVAEIAAAPLPIPAAEKSVTEVQVVEDAFEPPAFPVEEPVIQQDAASGQRATANEFKPSPSIEDSDVDEWAVHEDMGAPPASEMAMNDVQKVEGPVPEKEPVSKPLTPEVPSSIAAEPRTAAPSADTAQAPLSDNYFESKMNLPTNPATRDIGPRKVDPVQEPGSRFVVVRKTHSEQSQESLMISASRALKLGRYEAAIEMYDSLYSRNPKDPTILLGRAVSYQKAGRSEMALKAYDELLSVDKGNQGALLNMLGLLREQYPEVALRRLINLHEQYPDNAGIVAQMGLTEAELGHADDALRYLGMAASLEPKNAQHLFNMGIVADRKGDRVQAIKLYEQALEVDSVYGGGRSVPREQIYDRLSVLRRG